MYEFMASSISWSLAATSSALRLLPLVKLYTGGASLRFGLTSAALEEDEVEVDAGPAEEEVSET